MNLLVNKFPYLISNNPGETEEVDLWSLRYSKYFLFKVSSCLRSKGEKVLLPRILLALLIKKPFKENEIIVCTRETDLIKPNDNFILLKFLQDNSFRNVYNEQRRKLIGNFCIID